MNEQESAGGGPDLTATVLDPRDPDESREFTWMKSLKVGDAAAEAAAAFGFEPGQPTLVKGEEVLDREKPLVAAGVRDGDVLELTDVAGGV